MIFKCVFMILKSIYNYVLYICPVEQLKQTIMETKIYKSMDDVLKFRESSKTEFFMYFRSTPYSDPSNQTYLCVAGDSLNELKYLFYSFMTALTYDRMDVYGTITVRQSFRTINEFQFTEFNYE